MNINCRLFFGQRAVNLMKKAMIRINYNNIRNFSTISDPIVMTTY